MVTTTVVMMVTCTEKNVFAEATGCIASNITNENDYEQVLPYIVLLRSKLHACKLFVIMSMT